ncbi:MAG TPA: NAD-dependent epimerase/dehydratase family protein, partial [Acidimicrobiia bacterium]
MPASSVPVVVTGATGFIAAEIVRQLLESGYEVRGTTRDVAAARASGELTSLPGADDRLHLVEVDLLAGGLAEVVADAEYVIHVASPYTLVVADPQRDLVDPAVDGTRSVLEAAAHAGSMKRVVLTSSFAAIGSGSRDTPYTESDWNEAASLGHSPYSYSKVMAERAAWEFVE